MIEPAYYVNLQRGVRYDGKRCMFWHLHALVWGVSRKELKKRLRKLVIGGRYVAIADGLDPSHTRKIKQGRLPAHVAYLLKSPSKAYRVSVRDREDESGQPITDADGVVLQQFKQGKSDLRHGDRIVLFHAMKHFYLDKLAVAGREGAGILRAVKRIALTPGNLPVRASSKPRPSPGARRMPGRALRRSCKSPL
jgi:hypothetical protein